MLLPFLQLRFFRNSLPSKFLATLASLLRAPESTGVSLRVWGPCFPCPPCPPCRSLPRRYSNSKSKVPNQLHCDSHWRRRAHVCVFVGMTIFKTKTMMVTVTIVTATPTETWINLNYCEERDRQVYIVHPRSVIAPSPVKHQHEFLDQSGKISLCLPSGAPFIISSEKLQRLQAWPAVRERKATSNQMKSSRRWPPMSCACFTSKILEKGNRSPSWRGNAWTRSTRCWRSVSLIGTTSTHRFLTSTGSYGGRHSNICQSENVQICFGSSSAIGDKIYRLTSGTWQ